jgi:hypothetical protein
MKKIEICIACCFLLFHACSKKNPSNPGVQDNPEQTIENASRIASQSDGIIERAVSTAFTSDGSIDPDAIANSIAALEGVLSATPTETGSGIGVRMPDGRCLNILLNRRDEDRLFRQTGGPSIDRFSRHSPTRLVMAKHRGTSSGTEYPEKKSAVILAPFQRDFNEDLSLMAGLLRSAGYTVSVFEDGQAGLSRFRADSLAKYGVVVISTHGLAAGLTLDDRVSTILVTGEPTSVQSLNSVTVEEMRALGAASVKGVSYWAATVQWLSLTLHGTFPKSWFFANGCETMRVRQGRPSLVECLVNSGVGGISGYDAAINTDLAEEIGWRLIDGMAQGMSLEQVSDDLRGDIGLSAYAFYLRNIACVSTSTVDPLGNIQRIAEPFTLFPVQTDFPYTECRFKFFSRASYNKTSSGDYTFAFNRDQEVSGSFSNGVFSGTSTGGNETHTLEITLDLLKHQITHFRLHGTLTGGSQTTYSIESKGTPLTGNVTNAYFHAAGTDLPNYTGNVTYESTWTEAGGVQVTDRLTGVNYDADSNLEIQFY